MSDRSTIISDKHLAAMGHVANVTAQLEFQIDLGIWELVGGSQQLVACVTAQMISAHPRLKAFIGLAEILGASENTIADLKTLSGHIGGLIEKRNRMLHDPRMVKQSTQEVARLQITAKPKVHFGFIPETEGEVNQVGNDIGAKVNEFIVLRDKTVAELAPLRETSLGRLQKIIAHQE